MTGTSVLAKSLGAYYTHFPGASGALQRTQSARKLHHAAQYAQMRDVGAQGSHGHNRGAPRLRDLPIPRDLSIRFLYNFVGVYLVVI